MIASLDATDPTSDRSPGWHRWRDRLVGASTAIAWIVLAGLIAASYVGHAPSPYGVCPGATGRGVACRPGRLR